MQGQVQRATEEFGRALEEMRKKDQKDLVVFYNSKALAEYSIGVLLEGADSTKGAREAYGRALQEDLAYYPAHMRLGLLSLGLKDTTTAMSELALASQIAPAEPHIRYVNGYVLAACGHYAEAAVELTKAVELEPFYALPYLRLALVNEQLDKGKEALDAYLKFISLAAASDPQRQLAIEHANDIKEILGASWMPKP
jgi:tetratricopeptide (TPR) repeat protein